MDYAAIVNENRRALQAQLAREMSDEEYLILLTRILRDVRCTNPTSIADRVYAFFEIYYPEITLKMGPGKLARTIAKRCSFAREVLADRWTSSDSIGADLDDKRTGFLTSLLVFFDANLVWKRRTRGELLHMLETRISGLVRRSTPSLSALLDDDVLCALLIERAGGVSTIAMHSSNYVQMLGAERSFFSGARPKHGLIATHVTVRGTQRPGRNARRLADAITRSAREDSFRCS